MAKSDRFLINSCGHEDLWQEYQDPPLYVNRA